MWQSGREGPRGRSLWQFPNSTGRQREQGVLFLSQEHLRHLAVPLQRQKRVTGPLGRELAASVERTAIFHSTLTKRHFQSYLGVSLLLLVKGSQICFLI